MKKVYGGPTLTVHGDVSRLTAQFGDQTQTDFVFGLDGSVVEEGRGSIDLCPTQDQEDCVFAE